MSAVPTKRAVGKRPDPGSGDGRRLSSFRTVYLVAITAAAASVTAPLISRLRDEHHGAGVWTTFMLLAGGAALAQILLVKTSTNHSYHATNVFLIPAILLLPPELIVLVTVVHHIPAWLKNRTAWYRESFNVSNYVLAALGAWGAARLVLQAHALIPDGNLRFAVGGLVCAVVLVGLNHAMLAPKLAMGDGHSFRESGLFSFHGLTTEFVLAALGVLLATFWNANPWLIPFAIAPGLLIHRSLSVPQLEAEARIDPKTGLFNERHFGLALNEEITRAERFDRPLALIMADLDLLRDINNSYGHLAGDAVLKGIAAVFRTHLRHYDVPARFGGEEFTILLPETGSEEALEIAERIRKAVAERAFDVETSSQPIRATISIGVAAFPRDGRDANELIHQADLAVYRAKLQGRNRVLDATSEPLAVPVDHKPRLAEIPEVIDYLATLPAAAKLIPAERRHSRTRAFNGPRFLSLSRRSAQQLRAAAETIQNQNISLQQANRLLRERSTAAMVSLSATVDARDASTAGHSRRVQQLSLAMGRELGLSRAELDLLGHAALFHDIGKLTVPDAILLKPAILSDEEWSLMQRHSDEGARIIDRLGFLNDAVPAIRHHHERFDGTGYPDGLHGEEIPLGARIIHVADALDSMLTTRIYRAARPALEAMEELKRAAGTQFCPRCIGALEQVLPPDILQDEAARQDLLAAS